MNWFQELQTCELDVFAGIAVDAYRSLNTPDSPVSLTEFLHEASSLLIRRSASVADRFRILLVLSFELGDGRIVTVDRALGPVIKVLQEADEWRPWMDGSLASFGLAARKTQFEEPRAGGNGMKGSSVGRVTYLASDDHRDVKGRVVIVTALDKEFNAFRSFLGPEDEPSALPGLRTVVRRPGADIVLVGIGEAGNVTSALATKRAIDKWNPGLVMLSGITGGFAGVRQDFELGDVIVPDEVVGYESARLEPGNVSYRIKVGRSGNRASALAKEVAEEADWLDTRSYPPDMGFRVPQVHLDGAVFSGEKVVADAVEVSKLKSLWGDALGTEMEAIGLMLAVYGDSSAPEALFVKSVCDWADRDKDDKYQEFAAFASASFAVEVATRWTQKYPNVARKGVSYATIGDLHAFWHAVDDRSALELCVKLGIDQFVYRAWEKGDYSLRLVEYLQRSDKLSDLLEAVLAIGRPDLVTYIVGNR